MGRSRYDVVDAVVCRVQILQLLRCETGENLEAVGADGGGGRGWLGWGGEGVVFGYYGNTGGVVREEPFLMLASY